MSHAFAGPACALDIYPFEGGPISLQDGKILAVTVRKSLNGGSVGTAQIDLAPGGPRGAEDPVTWSQVITPMSHVVIAMSRGAQAAVVFDGIVPAVGETQSWRTTPQGSSASRAQSIAAADFAWFFRSFNWFALTYYGLMAGTPVGNALNYLPAGLSALINKGLIGGNSPVEIGRLWYQDVMAGANGVMAKTFVPYYGGSRVSFTNAVGALWENYPDGYIPVAEYFMVSEESWMSKFQSIFPHPWYEFFITTAPSGAYVPENGFAGIVDQGSVFSVTGMPYAEFAGPQLVARVVPTPNLSAATLPSVGQATFGNIDVSRWNKLPLYDFTAESFGFFQSSISFSADGASNFYQLNPTSYRTLFGNNNANNIPFIFSFIAAADAASVQRYGFRPKIGTTRWMYDPDGKAAQSEQDIQSIVLALTSKYVSWFHPQPLMAMGSVMIPLSPSVLVGTRFRYAPFKDGISWDFYVEGFEHRFAFGGTSYTRLTLTRGLPTAVYQATTSDGILRAVHTGNAMRRGGAYVVGLPDGTGPALQFVVTSDQAAELNQRLSNVPSTPQAQ